MVIAVAIAVAAMTATIALKANDGQSSSAAQFKFQPNSLVLSRSVYAGDANTVAPGQTLPPGCVAGVAQDGTAGHPVMYPLGIFFANATTL